jgi:hypothetical protein
MKDPTNKELVFCSSLMPVVGFVHMGLSAVLCRHSHACAAISFYICTWFYGQAANQAIKNVFWRKRPTACLSTFLRLTDASIPKPHAHAPWNDYKLNPELNPKLNSLHQRLSTVHDT